MSNTIPVNNNKGPVAEYKKKLASGHLMPDRAQAVLAEQLQILLQKIETLENYSKSFTWKKRLGFKENYQAEIKGLYIYGDVGRGKSMLMDLFYSSIQIKKKRRVHFHAFLQDIHLRFNLFRKNNPEGGDPVPTVVKSIVEESKLLCFDELQVVNIVDAMILGRLFEGLLSHNVIIIATSNRPPDDLYKDGLQRDRFLPFIKLLKNNLNIEYLGASKDYRLEKILGMRVYHYPLGKKATVSLDDYFLALTEGYSPSVDLIEVKGRVVTIPVAAAGVARISFVKLCGEPLGPADYLDIAGRYHTLILDDIPRMDESLKNEARRFITLIDALYENKVNLICSADAPPQELYVLGEGAFEFQRLVSRLMEMQSEEYVALPHGLI